MFDEKRLEIWGKNYKMNERKIVNLRIYRDENIFSILLAVKKFIHKCRFIFLVEHAVCSTRHR